MHQREHPVFPGRRGELPDDPRDRAGGGEPLVHGDRPERSHRERPHQARERARPGVIRRIGHPYRRALTAGDLRSAHWAVGRQGKLASRISNWLLPLALSNSNRMATKVTGTVAPADRSRVKTKRTFHLSTTSRILWA